MHSQVHVPGNHWNVLEGSLFESPNASSLRPGLARNLGPELSGGRSHRDRERPTLRKMLTKAGVGAQQPSRYGSLRSSGGLTSDVANVPEKPAALLAELPVLSLIFLLMGSKQVSYALK